MIENLALVSLPGHDWPWVTCGHCHGEISRKVFGGAAYYESYCEPPEYEECHCAETDYPGLEPWPEDDPTVALLPPGAFTTHRVLWNEYPHALYAPGEVPADAPF